MKSSELGYTGIDAGGQLFWTCNFCGTDFSHHPDKEYAVMECTLDSFKGLLCHQCRLELIKKIRRLAIEYLT